MAEASRRRKPSAGGAASKAGAGAPAEKRGRGRPPGSKNGQHRGAEKETQAADNAGAADGPQLGADAESEPRGEPGQAGAARPVDPVALELDVEPVGALPDEPSDLDDSPPSAAAPGGVLQDLASKASGGAAGYVLTMWECLAIGLIGPDAGMLPSERSMIQPAIQRIIQRLSPDVVGAASQWGDYIMLAVGVAMYGQRLVTTRRTAAAAIRDAYGDADGAPLGGTPRFSREPTAAPPSPGEAPSNLVSGDWRAVFNRGMAEAGEL